MNPKHVFHKTFVNAAIAYYISDERNRWKEILLQGANTISGTYRNTLLNLLNCGRLKFNEVICTYIDSLP